MVKGVMKSVWSRREKFKPGTETAKVDFFRFKSLLSGENQRGGQDSFLVPLKNDGNQ